MPSPLPAKCIAHCMESKNCIQYLPNDMFNIIYSERERQSQLDVNLSDEYQRRLVYLKTPRGKWIITFDRAEASDTALRIFFCKECGEPFDRLNDIGTHTRAEHNKDKKRAENIKADTNAEVEAELLAEVDAGKPVDEVIAEAAKA